MKKILFGILIINCLISLINPYCEDEDGEETIRIRHSKDCTSRIISEAEQSEGGFRCCYMREKVDLLTYKGKIYSCILLNQNEYNDIKNFIKSREKESGIKDVKIDCKSFYLHIGLTIVLALLL